ncbi:MAG: zinc ABC transporter substrate-binding protein, partial [bacterium]|nr:zinc ABC transporter substrate-binding protein [bacterium]
MNIFSEIRKLNFPPEQYIVVGSGVMAAKGIRKTKDLDIVVTPELFEKCVSEGWEVHPWTKESIPGKEWLKKDSVELYVQLSRKTGGIPAKELLTNSEVIEGIPFITLETLIDFKRE